MEINQDASSTVLILNGTTTTTTIPPVIAGQPTEPGSVLQDKGTSAAQFFGPMAPLDDEDGDEEDQPEFVASTANAKDGTIDCVWYGGQAVIRYDYDSGDNYMLQLDMDGCRLDRLNSGAPIFDSHMSGMDYASAVAGKMGTRAHLGSVVKAGSSGCKGMATLKFDMGSHDGAEMFRKAATGIVRNLSFGTWIYKRKETDETPGPKGETLFVATDWEPFEVSPVPVPADFSTEFLGAAPQVSSAASGAGSIAGSSATVEESREQHMTEQQLAAEKQTIEKAAILAERQRGQDIRAAASKFNLDSKFVESLIAEGLTLDQAQTKILEKLGEAYGQATNGKPHGTVAENVSVTRDAVSTKFSQMEAALLMRHDPKFGLGRKVDHSGTSTNVFIEGRGPEYQAQLESLGREYRGFSLMDMARESLTLRGISWRGMNKNEVAERALSSRSERFAGAESTSDFPSALANVANKTLRQAYEAWPQTFRPFSRMVTATDFKPINRVQLSDAPTLQKINEKGEFRRSALKDSNQSYKLATFGEIVALTRAVVINDDLNAFTRVPALLGVSAAQMESDTVWAVITGNQTMEEDTTALFHANHNNSLTGAGSALALAGLKASRAKMRLQKAQNGTVLNLVPRYLIMPAAIENDGLQLLYPINIASSDVTKVIPEWVRGMLPIVEPRLDAASTTAWYVATDSAQIDTIEYCYLEGQQGVYIETRQGFDVDGIEIKVREDFAAAAIDFRGLQKNAGT